MSKKSQKIYDLFDGKLVGGYEMKKHTCKILSRMPRKIIDFITRNCWFMASMDDAWSFTFTGNDLRNQHLIFLSDGLFRQNVKQINYSIAHEIGHVILGHKNSTLKKQTKKEVSKQEKEAHKFAKKYTQ